jgi:fructose-1,6-bisphosphatase/inositol monophosphatase family enzyme
MESTHEFQPIIQNCFRQVRQLYSELENEKETTKVVDRTVDFKTVAEDKISETIQDYFADQPTDYQFLSEESSSSSGNGKNAVIVDEIDGTANMIAGDDLPFGPCLAITKTTEPCFQDVLAMGFLSLHSGDLYEAYKNRGAFLTKDWAEKGEEASTRKLSTSSKTDLTGPEYPKLLVDQHMLSGVPNLADLCCKSGYPGDFRSWAYHMSLVARGSYDLAITGDHCSLQTEKHSTPEELAGGYLLVSEAGGVVSTWEGNDVGESEIGMARGKTFDVVVAATNEIARDFTDRLKVVDVTSSPL